MNQLAILHRNVRPCNLRVVGHTVAAGERRVLLRVRLDADHALAVVRHTRSAKFDTEIGAFDSAAGQKPTRFIAGSPGCGTRSSSTAAGLRAIARRAYGRA